MGSFAGAKQMEPLTRLGFLGDVVPRLKRFAHPLHFQSGVSADNTSCDVSSDSISHAASMSWFPNADRRDCF